jgi:hypothetical protein
MAVREALTSDDPSNATSAPAPNLIIRGTPNWTGVWFFCALGLMHLTIWTWAMLRGRSEAYLSLAFGTIFEFVALACWLTRFEIAVLPSERRVRLRTGYRRLRFERSVSFRHVRGVRLTMMKDPDHSAGLVEIICDDEAIECPATAVARQEALCLALTMGVRLIKVSEADDAAARPPRKDTISYN